ERKLQEILLAIKIERRLTKHEILERYLNQVYFGHGAYGVQMASLVYFGKHVRDLTLPEAALIAGLIQAPSRLAPFDNFEGARRRREVVLRQMADVGIISRSQAEKAMRAKVELRADRTPTGLTGIRAPYFLSYLIPFLSQRYGEDQLYKGGLQIHTTLEPKLQQLAQSVVTKGVAAAQRAGLRLSQGALVAIDPRTGHIKAMVGGVDFRTSQFNRAWQSQRQPGSAFKPFIYVTALGKGITPERILDDRPIEYRIAGSGTWKPQNYDRKYYGPISLRAAVELSRNVPVIRLIEEIGAQDVIATAQRMGIRSPLQPNLSLALGTSEVTPLEMASAYGTLAAGGVHAQPIAVTRVLDTQGHVLEEVGAQRKIAVSPEAAYVMTDILRGVVLRGTGTAANIGSPVAGKTGTTDDYRNAWFVGYTPTLSTAVWVGNDDNRPMNRVTGGSTPALLWAEFARGAIGIQKTPPLDFARPDNVGVFSVCVKQGEDGKCELYQTRARVRDDAALGSFAGRGGQSGTEVSGNGPAALRPVFLRPLPGAVMLSPFVVEGRVAPGARVRMRVVMEGGAVPTDVAKSEVPVGPDGGFGYHFETALKFPGARYVITASATHPDGTLTSATITIVER
ncbi:MAG: PBP1A family penicillin-binding protein, partial [Armatimonadetes bacterium]|nr:PBP1A family penicillin-binding protein [Armatimonadota bacterium]